MSLFDLEANKAIRFTRERADYRRTVVSQYNAQHGPPPPCTVDEAVWWLDLLSEMHVSVYEQEGVLEITPPQEATPGRLATLEVNGAVVREAMKRRST